MRTRFVTALHHKKKRRKFNFIPSIVRVVMKVWRNWFSAIQNQMHFEQFDYRTCACFQFGGIFTKWNVVIGVRRCRCHQPVERVYIHFCFHLTSIPICTTRSSVITTRIVLFSGDTCPGFFLLLPRCAARIRPSFINTSHQHQHTIISISLSLLLLLTSFCYTQFPFNVRRQSSSITFVFIAVNKSTEIPVE